MANVLSKDKQIAVIGALAEGSSIRSIERITGINRNTIMNLGVRVGKGCTALLDAKMRDLPCRYLQFDEVWGYVVVLFVVLGLAFVVARQDQRAADKTAEKAATLHQTASPAKADEQHTHEHVDNSDGDSPSWYHLLLGLFRWPVGTGTWVIVLTLLAIAEQTSETRHSVKIATRSLVSQFRPKLVVKNINLAPKSTAEHVITPSEVPPWRITLLLKNSGGTVAHIHDSPVEIGWFTRQPDKTELIQTEQIKGFSLEAGEDKSVSFIIQDPLGSTIHIPLHVAESGVQRREGFQMTFIQCSGTIVYADDIGTKRKTGFERLYQITSQSFIASGDPEREYQD